MHNCFVFLVENELKAKCQEITKLKEERDALEQIAAKQVSKILFFVE